MMDDGNRDAKIATALAVLDNVVDGTLDVAPFTDNASWWSDFGVGWPVAEFNGLLGTLHAQTIPGLRIRRTRTIADSDVLTIEADSNAELKNGRIYANRCAFIFEFRDDQIQQVKEYNDTYHVAEIFGLKT